MVSPFMGGGSVEIYIAAATPTPVYASDGFDLLINFWHELQRDPEAVADRVYEILCLMDYDFEKGEPQTFDVHEAMRDMSERCFNSETDLDRAAYFFVRNKTSWGGAMFKGVNQKKGVYDRSINIRKTKRDISMEMLEKLRSFFTPAVITHLDYREALDEHEDRVAFCDPPYFGVEPRLYGVSGDGQKGFDHYEFAERMFARRRGFAICYDNHPEIRRIYRKYHIIERDAYYSMKEDKNAKELIICSEKP